MAVSISEELKKILDHKNTLKLIASIDTNGVPHVTVKTSLNVTKNGELYYLEFFENSKTNKNLIGSLWFNKVVAINIVSEDRRSFLIKGRVKRTAIAGREFEKFYKDAQAQDEKNDLSAIYYIDPEEIREETFEVRREEEAKKNPLYIHLDRLVK
ncbi:MAG: hypothetical protein ACFWTJ_00695 [Lachnoclostridium sp.]|mgnify:CR=1 FL=1